MIVYVCDLVALCEWYDLAAVYQPGTFIFSHNSISDTSSWTSESHALFVGVHQSDTVISPTEHYYRFVLMNVNMLLYMYMWNDMALEVVNL
jgi:hypothetical protein